mmetsp:Transcript_68125/g.112040  ORF Transcript_68125/g.112040 Transcript_68125/m.112040 type:complete len:245 (+) Transcript_68125:240-974(+)
MTRFNAKISPLPSRTRYTLELPPRPMVFSWVYGMPFTCTTLELFACSARSEGSEFSKDTSNCGVWQGDSAFLGDDDLAAATAAATAAAASASAANLDALATEERPLGDSTSLMGDKGTEAAPETCFRDSPASSSASSGRRRMGLPKPKMRGRRAPCLKVSPRNASCARSLAARVRSSSSARCCSCAESCAVSMAWSSCCRSISRSCDAWSSPSSEVRLAILSSCALRCCRMAVSTSCNRLTPSR